MYEIIKRELPVKKYDELKKLLSILNVGEALVVNTDNERKVSLMHSKRSGNGHKYVSRKRPDGRFEIYRYE